MKFSSLSNKELLELQKKFRKGLIKENDIEEDVLNDLKELYHIQIEFLKKSIQEDKKEIIKIRKKLSKN